MNKFKAGDKVYFPQTSTKVLTVQENYDVDFDDLDNLFDDFDGVAVEGGVDNINDEGCEGGACKL